jgi:aminoacylase
LSLSLDEITGKLKVTPKERKDLETFKTFLSFKTVSADGPRNGEYARAVSFLENVAKSLGLDTKIYELVKNKPILLCSYQGTDPSLKSILLNSHYDVVPAVNEMWHTDPFVPVEEANGDIYGRGAQDMKCVCIQHLLAVGRLVASGKRPCRTIYLTFVPDEEIGGVEGLGMFLAHSLAHSLTHS